MPESRNGNVSVLVCWYERTKKLWSFLQSQRQMREYPKVLVLCFFPLAKCKGKLVKKGVIDKSTVITRRKGRGGSKGERGSNIW